MAVHGNSKYDWDGWFKRKIFKIVQGKQYVCSQSNMVQQVRNAAAKRRRKVSVYDHGDRIEVRVLGRSTKPRRYLTVGG